MLVITWISLPLIQPIIEQRESIVQSYSSSITNQSESFFQPSTPFFSFLSHSHYSPAYTKNLHSWACTHPWISHLDNLSGSSEKFLSFLTRMALECNNFFQKKFKKNFRLWSVHPGEIKLNFYFRWLATLLVLEIFGVFHIYVIEMVVVHFSYHIWFVFSCVDSLYSFLKLP